MHGSPEALRTNLAHVRCPVRQLLGTAPHDGGPGSRELASVAAVADYSVLRIDAAGHFLHEQQPPDDVAAAVIAASRGSR